MDAEDTVDVRPVDMESARYRHPGEYLTGPMALTGLLLFDMTRGPFDDPRVRRAFAHATDRESFADVILRGYFSPALGGLVPPGVPGHSPDIGLKFDRDRARELLAEAGYPGGQGFPTTRFLFPSILPELRHLQTQWRDNLGVDVISEEVDWAKLIESARNAPAPIFFGGWAADYPDPDNFLRVFLGEYMNLTWNESFHRRVEEARQITNPGERIAIYQESDRILVEEAAVMPLVYGRLHFLLKPWVKRYPTCPVRWHFWKEVILEAH